MWGQILLLNAVLYLFLVSIGMMGGAFKLFGKGVAQQLVETTSIPLVGAGILTVEQIFPYTLGSNVGTTVTAMLAALSTASVPAITIAFAHLFFNLSGIGIVFPIPQIRRIPIRLATALATFTSSSRGLAIVYIVVVFYVVPAAIIYLWG